MVAAPPSGINARRYHCDVRIGLVVLGILVVLSGVVWIAQGLNLAFAPGSFMTGERTWVVIGAAAILIGLIMVGRARRRS